MMRVMDGDGGGGEGGKIDMIAGQDGQKGQGGFMTIYDGHIIYYRHTCFGHVFCFSFMTFGLFLYMVCLDVSSEDLLCAVGFHLCPVYDL